MENLFRPRKIIAAILIIIAVAFCIVLLNLDRVSKKSIEQIATATLGTNTTIEEMNLGLLDGRVKIDGLTVNNPQGFTTPYLIKIKQLELTIEPTTLFGNVLEVKKFEINQFKINFEQHLLKNNLLTIVKNLQSTSQEGTEGQAKDEKGKRLRLTFDRLAVNDVFVDLTFSLLGTPAKNLNIQIPNLKLNNFSSDEVEELLISEFIRKLVLGIIVEIVGQSHENLPIDLPKTLSSTQYQNETPKKLIISNCSQLASAKNSF